MKSSDPAESARGWEALVSAYWKPAYKHLRVKWSAPAPAAADAVQAFFARAVERDFFAAYDPGKARFRTFFKLCLDRHQANALDHERATHGPTLDFADAEAELERAGAAAYQSPDEVFDREWKRQVFSTAISALKVELPAVVFRVFEQYDLCELPRPRYEDLAREHGLPVTTITNHLFKARRALRQQVQAQLDAMEDAL